MKKISCLLFIIVAAISLSSCKKEDNPVNNSTEIPYLKVGNKWVYNATGFAVDFSTTTNEITEVNNGIYTLTSKFDDKPGDNVYLYGENGYLNWFDIGQTKGANQQVLKYSDLKVGDKWTRVTPADTYYHECVSVNETVTVPAGTFVCKKIHVTFQNAFNDETVYWSDEYGQIKIENLLINTELASKNF